jgi:xylan 1,4-beta-xylosidase
MTIAKRCCGFATVLLASATIFAASKSLTQSGATVAITVELGRKLGPYKPIYAWFGYDEANFTTMRDGKNFDNSCPK